MTENATIQLSSDEALVLFGMLYRWFEDGETTPVASFEHDAETTVLSDKVLAQLQKQLVAPFDPNYDKLLEKARQNVSRT